MPRLRPIPEKKEEEQQLNSELFELKEDGEIEQEIEKEIKVKDPDKSSKDDSQALKKQIEDLQKAERVQRERAEQAIRDREEALRRANQREAEALRSRKEVTGSQLDAVKAAMAAASAEAESAQKDLENAVSIGDTKAQGEAYRRLARAEANLAKLEDGKIALEEQQKTVAESTVSATTSNDPVENSNLPETAKKWLREHPEYLTDPRKNAKIQALHWDVVEEGHAQFSDAYFESLETHLGLRQKKVEKKELDEKEEEEEDESDDGASFVSAPVSRETISNNSTRPSQIRLTKAQSEAAKMAGITDVEYAKQLIKLGKLKKDGHYGEGQ